jgi:hypothetical protein
MTVQDLASKFIEEDRKQDDEPDHASAARTRAQGLLANSRYGGLRAAGTPLDAPQPSRAASDTSTARIRDDSTISDLSENSASTGATDGRTYRTLRSAKLSADDGVILPCRDHSEGTQGLERISAISSVSGLSLDESRSSACRGSADRPKHIPPRRGISCRTRESALSDISSGRDDRSSTGSLGRLSSGDEDEAPCKPRLSTIHSGSMPPADEDAQGHGDGAQRGGRRAAG